MKAAQGLLALLVVVAGVGHGARAQERALDGEAGREVSSGLRPTVHAPLPARPSLFLLIPDREAGSQATAAQTVAQLARGVRLIAEGNHTSGLPLVRNRQLASSRLAAYAQYYEALALAGLGRSNEAELLLRALNSRNPVGLLNESVPLQLADIATSARRFGEARAVLEKLSQDTLSQPEEVLLRLGRVTEADGDRAGALSVFRRIYYEFALSPQAVEAGTSIERLEEDTEAPPDRVVRDIARADRLFGDGRWTEAWEAFTALARTVGEAQKDLVQLRIAECNYYLGRLQVARDMLRPYLAGGVHEAEARFFHLSATRALREQDTYVALARRFVDDHPTSPWTERTLDDLASHYVIADDDPAADRVFREVYARFPRGRFAGRAAWKAGWFSYRQGRFADAVEMFENAAATQPRSDYRPAWLYWSGRARAQMDDAVTAMARYRLVVTDYQNSYYGRLASVILAARRDVPAAPQVVLQRAVSATESVPSDALIRELIAVGMYEDALKEVQYAQRVWGDSPVLQGTAAYVRHQQGLGLKATERFNALRGAITTMRRAYPQFMAAGGERLPPEVLRVIFPLDYWPLIQKYAEAHRLDPFLIAALMAQESTFTAEIRSSANAYGLMQIIPATGRRYARRLGIRPFSPSSLNNPDTNVRIGTQYFRDLVERFGSPHYALAGYNAGEARVARWLKEHPGLAEDEFVDNIPFAETQGYVKRILGTAEDYRRLYGGGVLSLPTPTVLEATRRSD